jgi:flagellar protein FlbD
MIKVTRINDSQLVLNADLIESVESSPDTIISLTTGKKIVVRESVDEIIARVASFKRMCGVRPDRPDAARDSEGHDNG